MYVKGHYKGLSEEKIKEKVKKEGFDPLKITDPPGRIYSRHTHPETKLLAILDGGMDVKAGDKDYQLRKGDKLIIEGNVPHEALVGRKGCIFFWSEKLI